MYLVPNKSLKIVKNKYNFENQSFDVIYAHLSLHYFDDLIIDRIMDNLHRILRKGGMIFIKCKSIDDPLFGQGEEVGPNRSRRYKILKECGPDWRDISPINNPAVSEKRDRRISAEPGGEI